MPVRCVHGSAWHRAAENELFSARRDAFSNVQAGYQDDERGARRQLRNPDILERRTQYRHLLLRSSTKDLPLPNMQAGLGASLVRTEELSSEAAKANIAALADLLQDAVDSGASVGFLPPLGVLEARDYWCEVTAALDGGNRILIAAFLDAEVVGAVQLDLAARPNALHRAEVMKLFVHRRARRQGIGTVLMKAVENCAGERDRSLLVLDTREGDPSEQLYVSLGYRRAGVIPRYARSASGELHGTVFFYREIGVPTITTGS
jgi:GNAT superfamily N-acetyltransferase